MHYTLIFIHSLASSKLEVSKLNNEVKKIVIKNCYTFLESHLIYSIQVYFANLGSELDLLKQKTFALSLGDK